MTAPVKKFDGGAKLLVRCPKCGYVSFPGLPKCKKCGRPFPSPSEPSPVKPADEVTAESTAEPAPKPREGPRDPIEVNIGPPDSAPPPQPPEPADWQGELSKRVEGFRQRRARLRGKDEGANLELDFDAHEFPREARERAIIDFPLNPPSAPEQDEPFRNRHLDEPPRPNLDDVQLGMENSPAKRARPSAQSDDSGPAPILVESPSEQERADLGRAANGTAGGVAGIGDRFVAGLLDVLVLLGGVGLFTLIFWRAGGRVTRQPVDLAVIAFVVGVFMLFYFGVMTALTSSTPGLIWTGLEIRTQNGQEPGVREAAWRAVGCVISAGALMLGYLWAVVDADGLTWHDRMSGTFIARSERPENPPETGVLEI